MELFPHWINVKTDVFRIEVLLILIFCVEDGKKPSSGPACKTWPLIDHEWLDIHRYIVGLLKIYM